MLDPVVLRDEVLNIMIAGRDTVRAESYIFSLVFILTLLSPDCCDSHNCHLLSLSVPRRYASSS
jgi:hypothetical protein